MTICPKPIAVVLTLLILSACESTSTHPISVDELSKREVIGKLGVPLGTAVEVEATVVDGSTLRMKAYDGLYLLKVTRVESNVLKDPQIFEFLVPGFIDVDLPSSKSDGSTPKDYTGKRVTLVVYEVGEFNGLPRNLPGDVLVWADRGFYLYTSLEVLAQRK